MPDVIIENPILNSPFVEPTRHFKFDDDGITNEIVTARRISSYFVPIPAAKKKGGKQLAFDTEWTRDRIEENVFVNKVRQRVSLWRQGGYIGVTPVTAQLLAYWNNEERDKKLFFCQIEALETAIYITEVANKFGDSWIANDLREANNSSNPGLPRMALKMATGAGKTVVMAMLIAWQALNKLANSQDARFSDAFLIVSPGITIRDRLRVLLPNDPKNYYRERDIIPAEQIEQLGRAKILITNYHAFMLKETVKANKTAKAVLGIGEESPFTETPGAMVRRVCKELGNKKNIIVINDEAHHCYKRRPATDQELLAGLGTDDKQEAKQRDEEARIWIRGIEAVKEKIGVKAIFDLSATPFFLRGSGYSEGTLFPWVVSDFSLVDAIESGIVKIPRVPIDDNSQSGEQPTFRELWIRIRDDLPKKGQKTEKNRGEPRLPGPLDAALRTLYDNYTLSYRRWEANTEARERGLTAPVFIVVCNNTSVSRMVFDYIAGWERELEGQTFVQAGKLDIFRNDNGAGGWLERPNTILVDSYELESGESMSKEFKAAASEEIEHFKREYARRFPGRDVEQITDEELLREVMNTVGKPGTLGENVRCVVSVSMLTEGWDANTVTHILGVRAFGTQLLCEQVVGRALRRMSYAVNDQGLFDPEYAEVYGVPFSFIPSAGGGKDPKPTAIPTRVRALADRIHCEITFPRLTGYRVELSDAPLVAEFTEESTYALSTFDIPTRTEVGGMIGESGDHRMYDLEHRRENQIAFDLAKRVLETKLTNQSDQEWKPWLFPQVLAITKRWMRECVTRKDNTFIQLLAIQEHEEAATERIYRSIIRGQGGEEKLLPILRAYDPVGSTAYVDFDTTKPVYRTDPEKCHISHVVADTNSWEQKMAEALEEMPEVIRYVKNAGLNFTIPYTYNGQQRGYLPDFIVVVNDGYADPLNLIIEVTGENKKDKQEKVATAETLWIPAVNNHRGFGRWGFIQILDPWDAQHTIRAFLNARALQLAS